MPVGLSDAALVRRELDRSDRPDVALVRRIGDLATRVSSAAPWLSRAVTGDLLGLLDGNFRWRELLVGLRSRVAGLLGLFDRTFRVGLGLLPLRGLSLVLFPASFLSLVGFS